MKAPILFLSVPGDKLVIGFGSLNKDTWKEFKKVKAKHTAHLTLRQACCSSDAMIGPFNEVISSFIFKTLVAYLKKKL